MYRAFSLRHVYYVTFHAGVTAVYISEICTFVRGRTRSELMYEIAQSSIFPKDFRIA